MGRDDIDLAGGLPEVMACYYKYHIDTAAVYYVQLLRDNIRQPFYGGDNIREEYVNLTFYESEPYDKTIVHRKIVSV